MHIHILGICGTFMAGLAAIARASGHRVTGSDQGVYPPMSDQLAALGIDIVEGYEADQLKLQPDVVVVGNVMTRGMPVVEAVLNGSIPYTSGPAWLTQNVLRGRRVVAVAGTHGKTTTTSLLAWILEEAGAEPGFLIGGVPRNFGITARLGRGAVFVIEADEYDTAFFDKRAKFLHYRPEVLAVLNLEFDHADIYENLKAIQWQFHQVIRALPSRGRLIIRADDANIRDLLAMGCWTPADTFASDPAAGADWTAEAHDGKLRIITAGQEAGDTSWQMTGNHNAENAIAALLTAHHLGTDVDTALQAIAGFTGVKRRLELRGRFAGVELYDDFAHHPTEIRRTIAGLQALSDSGRLLVVLEPRSNTMKRGVHRDQLAGALQRADQVWLFRPEGLDWDLAAAVDSLDSVSVCDGIDAIVAGVVTAARAGDKVVVMSNGDFQDIHRKLEAALVNSPG